MDLLAFFWSAVEYVFNFFTDLNVYIAGFLVYKFGDWFKRMAVKLWKKVSG